MKRPVSEKRCGIAWSGIFFWYQINAKKKNHSNGRHSYIGGIFPLALTLGWL